MTRFVAIQLGTSHWFNIAAARRDFGFSPSMPMADVTRLLHAHYQAGEGKPLAV